MKKILFILISVICVKALAQGDLSNYTIASADLLCGAYSNGTHTFDCNNGFICNNSVAKLYYSFSPANDETLGSSLKPYYTLLSGATSSYKIYGPFDPDDDYVTIIGSNAAPILTSVTNISSYPQFFSGNIIQDKFYIVEIIVNASNDAITIGTQTRDFPCSEQTPCENCLPSFQPVLGKYVISAWIKEENNSTATTYTNGHLRVTSGTNPSTSFYGSGQIIDGWQRIEGIITTDNVGNLKIELLSNGGKVYFDDIRIFPFEGSVITYVYDPVTLRLVAELDERNYAKIYEYDEEGKLIRVKKETEKGIMTIQENRENTHGN